LTDNTYVACCATGNGEDIIVSHLASRCCMELCHSDDTDDASSALAKSLGWFRDKQYLQSYPRPYVGLVCVTARDSCVKVNYVHTTDSMIVASQCDDSRPVVSISTNPSVPGTVASGFTVR
jgi:isoaspartyl peptidase/L-asparaginase-like protein (Ntn-hydrolase superfamily)